MSKSNQTFALGDKLRDRISGFEGIAVGCTTWMNGCEQYGLRAEMMQDNKPIETEWFDVQQLEIVEPAAFQVTVPNIDEAPPANRPGGPERRNPRGTGRVR